MDRLNIIDYRKEIAKAVAEEIFKDIEQQLYNKPPNPRMIQYRDWQSLKEKWIK